MTKDFFPGTKGAIFSPCGTFRYSLWRIWSPSLPLLMCIGLNPSTAGADKNDATIRREIGYATAWGFGGLLKGNLFAFCDTYQSSLRSAPDRVGPDNDLWLMRMRDRAGANGMFLAAWGTYGDFRSRSRRGGAGNVSNAAHSRLHPKQSAETSAATGEDTDADSLGGSESRVKHG